MAVIRLEKIDDHKYLLKDKINIIIAPFDFYMSSIEGGRMMPFCDVYWGGKHIQSWNRYDSGIFILRKANKIKRIYIRVVQTTNSLRRWAIRVYYK